MKEENNMPGTTPLSSSGLDFLIIGQGICGTFLSWYLKKANHSFLIIDESKNNSASKVAAGIINPVTGRRIVKTWRIDELLPFAWNVYNEFGNELNITAITQQNIIDFHPTPQMKLAFQQQLEENKEYVSIPENQNQWSQFFNYDFGCAEINPCYLVNLPELLPAYRKALQQQNLLLEEKFEIDKLKIDDKRIRYKDITANHIVFCDGVSSFNNPYFKNLPFAASKGEALLIEAENLPGTNIFKKGFSLVPWRKNIYWVGASYEWEFEHEHPTDIFRERVIASLQQWLKVPFKVVDHMASIRPATLERRPFVGFHPIHKTIGIFNGMGTKGCSLAPFFAKQFAESIIHQTSIYPEANVQRFQRILSKN